MGRSRGGTLRGASGTIRVERNDQGTALITAEDPDDALLGLGYCHARDRALQMRLVRTLGRGEASEHLSASDEMLEIDHFFRRLNFGGDAAEQEAALPPRARKGAAAYCEGVNLGFEEFKVPWELRLLGDRAKGDPWTFADIYLTAKVIGYVSLAISQAEIERWIIECVQNGISTAQLEELFPGKLQGLDVDLLRRIRLQDRIVPEKLWRVPGLPAAMASNNWVVAGAKSATGHPIAANDPHLQINRLPAFWYEAVLRWPSESQERYAMGATLPGTPGVIVGRNADVSWTVTYAFMDCVDSWVEECSGGRHLRGDEWVPFRVREETIRRKGKSPVVLSFYENEHGTLEGDPYISGHYLATRWSCGEQTGATSLDGLLAMLEARNVDEGRQCLGRLCNSSWNWLLSDREGNIGYQMAGKLPIRPPHASGLVPLPGWDPANDWRGFARLEDLPRLLNPPQGFMATANDDLNHLGKVRPINICVAPYRADRIRMVLARPGRRTIEEMQALQMDLHSLQAEQFMTLLRPILATTGTGTNITLLAEWDCEYRDDSRAAFLFERFYRELFQEVFGGDPGREARSRRLGVPVVNHLLDETTMLAEYYGSFDRVLLSERSVWFGGRNRDEVYRTVLARVLAIEARPYAEGRQIRLDHLLYGSKLPRFLGFDRGPIPLRGGRATVHQGQLLRGRGRLIACGPSYRFITDLAQDVMHTTLPGGASDRRFSPWYANRLADWLSGTFALLRARDCGEAEPRTDGSLGGRCKVGR